MISNNYFFLCLILLFFSCQKNDRSPKNDLLLGVDYNQLSNNSNKLHILDSICQLLQTKGKDCSAIDRYLELSTNYYYINEIEKSKKSALLSLQLAKKCHDSLKMAKSYYYLGDCYENTFKDSAYFYYNIAGKTYNFLKDFTNEAHMIFNKSYMLFYNGNYFESEQLLTKALKILEKTNDHELIFTCYTLLGNCLEKQMKIDEAMSYNRLSRELLSKMQGTRQYEDVIEEYKMSTTINQCNLYNKKGEFYKSIPILKGMLTLKLKSDNPKIYSIALGNLAYSLMKTGVTENVEKMFLESLRLSQQLKNDSDILAKETNLAEYYLFIADTNQCRNYLQSIYRTSKKRNYSNELLFSLKNLSLLDKNKTKFLKEYFKYSDSLEIIQSKNFDKYARIEYETTKILITNEKLSKKIVCIILVSIFFILALIVILIIRYIRGKKKEYMLINERNKANEELFELVNNQQAKIRQSTMNEKERIARELHDGVMNKIYGLRMNLGFFNSKNDLETINKREHLINELQKVESEIRIISHDLSNSAIVENIDFIALIRSIIENQENTSTIIFSLFNDSRIDWDKIDSVYKINIFRILQEIVLNVVKYSKANFCNLSFEKISNNCIEIKQTDDGIGFDVASSKSGIGLKNINERVKVLNSTFLIDSEIEKGTRIIIQINFPSPVPILS